MKPLPKIYKLDQMIAMFNQGCASFTGAESNTLEYEIALKSAARDVPDALELALKIYLENFPKLEPADRPKLEKANFHQLITLMKQYADPPLNEDTARQLSGFRKMRNEVTHHGAIPPKKAVQDAIEGTREFILAYFPVDEEHLRTASGSAETGETQSAGILKESQSAIFTRGHALVIGVGADLPITVQDATALYKLLTDPQRAAYPPTQVELLTEAAATRLEILAAFDRLAKRVNASGEATVFVYFSGHGGRIEHPERSAEYFLVPYGYEPSRRIETMISGLEFTAKIEALNARKLIVLLDCCHAGGIPSLKGVGETFVKSPVPPELLNVLDTGSGRIVIASSHEDEFSYTGASYSVFTACLLEALAGKAAVNKDGFARILDILIYLFKQVPQRAPGAQHPFVKKVLDLGDNFPLCYYAGGDKRVPGEAPVPEPVPITAGLTAGQRRRLGQKYDILQREWGLLSEKVKRMRAALRIENSVTIKFQLEQQLLDEEAQLARLGDELEEVERTLQQ